MTKLTLESYRTYWETYYSLKAGVESMDQYKAAVAKDEAMKFGLDIYNEVYGQKVLDAFIFNSEKCIPNDVAGNLGMRDPWDQIMGKGIAGVEGMPSYDIAIKANLNKFTEVVDEMNAILGSDELNDNQSPSVSVNGQAVIALGTDVATVDWTQYFSAEDGFDGVMDPALAAYDVAGVNTAAVGSYKVKATFTDKAENSASAEVTVIVYDAANTVAPTLTVKEELPTIAQDTDMDSIDWTTFVEVAQDASELDIKANIEADMSELDTSFPDFYFVTLTVTDYAGNTASVEIEVEVVAAE